ncbi:hypothetical protein QDA02_gp12 [Microbacterium phage Margaery]|uniref:Uncharacterized protein n=1 Tax=Microbacterium phage Margaery TaxID=2591217 RepID=A0A514DHR9_9CAUD|nr:hypothetical protein QDA02_gp12 [Microbacterium phage Margaery]QDH93153.1 hypothetical protein PBI_MARGAERY_96 [Microbacterium phage Margaery]
MRTKHAREIRRGIQTARDVIARRRERPSHMTPFGFRGEPEMPLWERAYHREMSRAVIDGRIKPPRGPSGISRPRKSR